MRRKVRNNIAVMNMIEIALATRILWLYNVTDGIPQNNFWQST